MKIILFILFVIVLFIWKSDAVSWKENLLLELDNLSEEFMQSMQRINFTDNRRIKRYVTKQESRLGPTKKGAKMNYSFDNSLILLTFISMKIKLVRTSLDHKEPNCFRPRYSYSSTKEQSLSSDGKMNDFKIDLALPVSIFTM